MVCPVKNEMIVVKAQGTDGTARFDLQSFLDCCFVE